MSTSEENNSQKDSLSKLRDLILVLTPFLYIAGYVSWAGFAYKSNLPLLPLIDVQYFVAGAIPIFVAIFFLLIDNFFSSIKLQLERYNKIRIATFAIGIITFAIEFAIWILVQNKITENLLINVIFTLLLISFLSTITLGQLLNASKQYKWFSSFRWLIFFICCLYFTFYYVIYIFPFIPYTMGGPNSKCASLILSRDNTSYEVEKLITNDLPENDIAKNFDRKVIQTEEVRVIFTGSEYWLITPKAESNMLIAIIKEDIKQIIWCTAN